MSYIKDIRTTQKVENNNYVVEAELPGYKKASLELNIQGTLSGYTVIKGKASKTSNPDQEKDAITLVLDVNPQKLDLEAAQASLEDGILTVKVPVKSALAKKSIKIL